MSSKLASSADAASLVRSADTVATSGFVGIGVPEELLIALERRFLETKEPRDLTLVFAAGQGDGKTRGLNRLGHDGLLARAIGGHWGLIPKVAQLALGNRIEAWNLPQGVISQIYREIAARRPGIITRVGLGTFVDPRQGGGRINDISRGDLVSLMEVGGETVLFYPSFPIHVALLRATTADEDGNLSMEREALVLDNLAMASAAHNCGGVVIAQVERMAASGSIDPKRVVVPGVLVDAVVIAQPENHAQTFATPYSPVFSGEVRAPLRRGGTTELDPRKVIARRCALELPVGGVVNLGIGMPEGVADVAEEEGVLSAVTLTAEPGILGGRPASGLDFGAAVNTQAVIAQSAQFDFYDGGGLDLACLGMAEVDRTGNVNVSRFGGRLAGAGGFINISQNARKVVFAGTFTAGGLKAEPSDGELQIIAEGRAPKFVETVEQITFSADEARRTGQTALYVTERAVFRLVAEGLELIEVAPGIDIERDILAQMGFHPLVRELAAMDPRLFRAERVGLETILFDLKLAERIALDEGERRLFLDFESLRVRTLDDIEAIRAAVTERLADVGHRVDVIVNYDRFDLSPELEVPYAQMVAALQERFYERVSRYSANGFTRMKLQSALTRKVVPSFFQSLDEAAASLQQTDRS